MNRAPVHATDLASLGLTVLQRDWLSANHIVFPACGDVPATVVDTGYARHSAMTLALVDHALSGQVLARIVNTHLHSDHCGGNHAFQQRDARVQAWIPALSHEAAARWDEERLSYRATGQHCERFRVDGVLRAGDVLSLGPTTWQVHAAPGHDPEAIVLFEPDTRTLIAGDALWEDRLAIIFPELAGQAGFAPARQTLDMIEALAPRTVIPGHGAVFNDVAAALQASRRRLSAFEQTPEKHVRHAARALLMFHLMEHRQRRRKELELWLQQTPIFQSMASLAAPAAGIAAWAQELIDGLIDDGLLAARGEQLHLAEDPAR